MQGVSKRLTSCLAALILSALLAACSSAKIQSAQQTQKVESQKKYQSEAPKCKLATTIKGVDTITLSQAGPLPCLVPKLISQADNKYTSPSVTIIFDAAGGASVSAIGHTNFGICFDVDDTTRGTTRDFSAKEILTYPQGDTAEFVNHNKDPEDACRLGLTKPVPGSARIPPPPATTKS